MCVSVCVCGVEGGGLGVEEVKEPKPQNMIREKESVLYADEGKKKVFFMLAQPSCGWCLEWRGQWDAVIG